MKILLIGASGMIGTRLLNEALSRNHHVIAAVRTPEKIAARKNVEAIALDLYDTKALQDLAGKVDVVISAASPRSSGNAEIESEAYVDALIAALGTTRLVLVGGAGTLNLPDGSPVADVVPEPYAGEAKGMRKAFEKLVQSELNFTVLAPAAEIAPGQRTATFRLGGRTLLSDQNGKSHISAEDYAVALLNEVESPAHPKQVFTAAY